MSLKDVKIWQDPESTSFPFWVIIDPSQNFKTDEDGLHNIACMIKGVWFSRETAEAFLKQEGYNFSKKARVYCMSGCYSEDWQNITNHLRPQGGNK